MLSEIIIFLSLDSSQATARLFERAHAVSLSQVKIENFQFDIVYYYYECCYLKVTLNYCVLYHMSCLPWDCSRLDRWGKSVFD